MDNSFRKLDSEMEKRRRKDQKVVGLEECFSSFFFFFWPCLQHMEVPEPGIEPMLGTTSGPQTTVPPGNSLSNIFQTGIFRSSLRGSEIMN